jgi:hypothetical protein
MKVYSDLSGQALAMYPSAISDEYVTRVFRFLNDQEQRFLVRDKLFRSVLQYAGVNGYDTSVLRRFFYSMRGAASTTDLSNTFDIMIGGQQYLGCVFDQDDFTVEVDQAENNSFQLKIKQIANNFSPAPALVITDLEPSFALAGSGDTTVYIAGSNFTAEAVGYFGVTALDTTFMSSTTLVVVIPSSLIATPSSDVISVVQGPQTSNGLDFEVTSTPPVSISFYAHNEGINTGALFQYSGPIQLGNALVLAVSAQGGNAVDFGLNVSATNGVTFNLVAWSDVQDSGGVPGPIKYSQTFLLVALNCPNVSTAITVSFSDSSAQSTLESSGCMISVGEYRGIAASSAFVTSAQVFYPGLADEAICGPMDTVIAKTLVVGFFVNWYDNFSYGETINFPDTTSSTMVVIGDSYLGWQRYHITSSIESAATITVVPSFPPVNQLSILGMVLKGA